MRIIEGLANFFMAILFLILVLMGLLLVLAEEALERLYIAIWERPK